MAIEKGTYSPFSAPPEETLEAMPLDESEGETLSMSLLGGKEVKPGDVVRIRVQSVNEEDGTWQGAYDEGRPQSSRMGAEMAMEQPAMEGM
jgi:hypothetical protein